MDVGQVPGFVSRFYVRMRRLVCHVLHNSIIQRLSGSLLVILHNATSSVSHRIFNIHLPPTECAFAQLSHVTVSSRSGTQSNAWYMTNTCMYRG